MNDITEFIPRYPEIKHYKNNLLNPYDGNFYNVLYHKKELYENKLEKIEKFPENGEFLKSQINFSRILSSYTPYNHILLMSEMGTGKTCASIALIEKILKSENSTFTGAMIFASGKGLLRNYKDEIVRQCTKGQYIPKNFDFLTSEEKERRINKLVYKYYDFGDLGSNLSNTFETFAKKIRLKSPQTIIEEYSNKIIVIDEVHNIRLSEYKVDEYGRRIRRQNDNKIDGVNIYKEFHRFLHLVKNSKIILMSGTPIKDNIEEFADIMNLILPTNNQFPTKKKFIDYYFDKKINNENENILELKPSKINEFKDKIKGLISYLKAIDSEVKKEFVGEKIGKLQHFLVYPDKMSIKQNNSYIKTFDSENEKKVVFNIKARQASLFVYPDGSYGEQGFKKYLTSKGKSKESYVLSNELKDALTMNCSKSYPPTDEDKNKILVNLQKYSSKYASCIKNLLLAYKQNKLSFVYCKFIYGSGLILFTQILNLFGFSEANGNENTEGLRYAYLNFDFNTSNKIKEIKDRFNRPDNYQGKFISVIIGSEIIAEGYSFLNIQEEHILTPHWNYSETDQAIARGYRFGSHKELIKNGIKPILRIFQYVSVPIADDDKNNQSPISIDLKLYETSEIKDINIKKLERIIKESSIDCGFNYERNFKDGNDDKRDCDYMDCNYKCDGIEQLRLSDKELDYSTYQLYYNSFHIENITNELSIMFRNNFKISLQNIIKHFLENYKEFEILTSLKNIINENNILYNKYGFKSFLREDNNIFFLVDSLSVNNSYFLEYYTSNPLVSTNENFSSIINSLYIDYIPFMIKNIFQSKNMDDIKNIIVKLPSEVQELLIENIIIAANSVPEININKDIREMLLEYYKNFYKKIATKAGDIYISTYLYDEENTLKCLDIKTNEWVQCSDENVMIYEDEKTNEINKLENNIYGYYGIYDNNKFSIKKVDEINDDKDEDIDKRTLYTGLFCGSYSKPELINFCYNIFKIDLNKILDEDDKKMANIKKSTRKNLIKEIKKNKYLETIDINNVDNLENNELYIISYWLKLKKSEFCEIIKNFFEENNLILQKR
jgi:hypothetical protein